MAAGIDIADDGTFLFREAVRINFGHLVAQQFHGDRVNVSAAMRAHSTLPCLHSKGAHASGPGNRALASLPLRRLSVLVVAAAQVRVWRGSELRSLQVHLSTPHQLVPNHSHDVKPSYYIYAGLVFTPLTSWYLRR